VVKYKVGPKRHRPKKERNPDAIQPTSIRLTSDIRDRLRRLLRMVGPRITAMTGRKAHDAEIIRAVMVRGIEQTEREFGIHEPPGGAYVLEDPID
jgi:hypothetical protein